MKKPDRRLLVFFLFCLFCGLTSQGLAEEAPEHLDRAGVFSIQLENDLWGKGSDRYYTHGTRLSYVSSEQTPAWLQKIVGYVPFFDQLGHLRTSYAIGQSIFTPEDISQEELIVDDRPYAGWLYGAVGLVSDHRLREGNIHSNRLDSLELNIGVVGPAALAEKTQKWVHKIVGSPEPKGWDNQLDNELGILLVYDRQWQSQYNSEFWGLGVDLTPHFGASLGNVLVSASLGATLRVGRDLPSDYGPPSIRPSLPGSGFFRPHEDFGWYFFTGLEGRYVAHSIFLDGNTSGNSHSVSREPWVGDLQVGLVLTWDHYRLSFTNIFRTDEFAEQKSSTEFGSISLSMRF